MCTNSWLFIYLLARVRLSAAWEQGAPRQTQWMIQSRAERNATEWASASTCRAHQTTPLWTDYSLALDKNPLKSFVNPERVPESDGNVNHLSPRSSETLFLICCFASKDNTRIIFVQLLKEMPLISQDLMLYSLLLFGKGLRPEIPICMHECGRADAHAHAHTHLCLLQKPQLKICLFYYTTPLPHINPWKIYFSLNSVVGRVVLLINIHIPIPMLSSSFF